jgi:hypothetical protein
MYWNNTWLNFFNRKNFFNKTIFFENIYIYLFSEKLFNFFFLKKANKIILSTYFIKILLRRKTKVILKHTQNTSRKLRKPSKKKVKYNFTRIWFIKYNNFILFTTFVFFYFKIKKKKHLTNKLTFKKKPNLFWRKKKSINLKKKVFYKLNIFEF